MNTLNITLILSFFIIVAAFSQASSISTHQLQNESLKLSVDGACSYLVTVKTKSRSRLIRPSLQISLRFGNNDQEVFVESLGNPRENFKRGSTDEISVEGPCLKQISFLCVKSIGREGWIPQQVKVEDDDKSFRAIFNNGFASGTWIGEPDDKCESLDSTTFTSM